MKFLGCLILLTGVSFAQLVPEVSPRRYLETAASDVSAQVVWSEPLGILESREARAAFTALAMTDPMHGGHRLRELRVDLATADWKGVVYVKELEIALLKKHADWLAKMANDYPKSTDLFSDRGEHDDPAPPLYVEYRGAGSDAILYLGGPGLRTLQFTGVAPTEIAAILVRGVKALKAH